MSTKFRVGDIVRVEAEVTYVDSNGYIEIAAPSNVECFELVQRANPKEPSENGTLVKAGDMVFIRDDEWLSVTSGLHYDWDHICVIGEPRLLVESPISE